MVFGLWSLTKDQGDNLGDAWPVVVCPLAPPPNHKNSLKSESLVSSARALSGSCTFLK